MGVPAGLLVTYSVLAGGFFGWAADRLGVGGSVGDGMRFLDGLVPGSGGATDQILQLPGKEVFGGAVKDWGNTNSRLIAQLGATNDRTVEKLLQGLDRISTTITGKLDTLADALGTTVQNLDESLAKNIQRLDDSLTTQTGRLDTVFQKQTKMFVFLGRIIITVLVLGALIQTLLRLASARASVPAPQQRSALIAVGSISAVALAVVWLWPDPSGLKTLEGNYRRSYIRALDVEDFQRAAFNASQLNILAPDNAIYRAWDLKSQGLREFFYRPTVMLSDDQFNELFAQFAEADDYVKDVTKNPDADIVALRTLAESARNHRVSDYVIESISTEKANALYSALPDGTPVVKSIREEIVKHQARLRTMNVPPDLLSLALLTGDVPASQRSGREALVEEYRRVYSETPKPPAKEAPAAQSTADDTDTLSLGSVAALGRTLDDQGAIASFYHRLTAQYYSFLTATANSKRAGATAQDQKAPVESFCSFFEFYRDWFNSNVRPRSQDITFIANYLSGPFMIVNRAAALRPTPASTCNRVSDTEMQQLSTQVDLLIKPLEGNVVRTGQNGAKLLRATAELVAQQQTKAFAEFEKYVAALATFPSLDALPPGEAKYTQPIKDIVQASAILGIYAPSKSGEGYVPVIWQLHEVASPKGYLSDTEWQQAALAYLDSRI